MEGGSCAWTRGTLTNQENPTVSDQTLQLLPFPPLTWRNSLWTAPFLLPGWPDFQSDGRTDANGNRLTYELFVHTPNRARIPPTDEQKRAFAELIAHAAAWKDAILEQLVSQSHDFRNWCEILANASGTEAAGNLTAELSSFTSLHRVHVCADAVIGLEFDCLADPEHAYAAMMTDGNVYFVGDSDMIYLANL